ncbi:hypothetical protein TWF281_006624 [Arthrobotrys megalospora]
MNPTSVTDLVGEENVPPHVESCSGTVEGTEFPVEGETHHQTPTGPPLKNPQLPHPIPGAKRHIRNRTVLRNSEDVRKHIGIEFPPRFIPHDSEASVPLTEAAESKVGENKKKKKQVRWADEIESAKYFAWLDEFKDL